MASSSTRRSALPRRRRWVAVLVVAWTAITWGGRIGLLTAADTHWADIVRIGGSLALALPMAWALWRAPPWLRRMGTVFITWTVVIWVRAVVVAWVDRPSLAFAVVHTVLALAWLGVALAVNAAIDEPDRVDGADETDGIDQSPPHDESPSDRDLAART